MTQSPLSQVGPDAATLVTGWATAAQAGPEAQLDWLHRALETAIRLEFATIPPYLTALWSIKDPASPVALAIRGIVQEEMLHMALACNMLVAIGGTPPIAAKEFAPSYPGPLPGGVHPSLRVSLSGLTPNAVKVFMTIERPEATLTNEATDLVKAALLDPVDDGATRIGQFYDCILDAFSTLKPKLSTDRQISGPLSWYAVRTFDEVLTAINLIKHQGEGTESDPGEQTDKVTGKQELSHFYRFLEIHSRKAIGLLPDNVWGFTGELVSWPEVWPVAEVPAGGHDASRVPAPVADLLMKFDRAYGLLLQQLHVLWATGDHGLLVAAIGTMFTMQDPARALMQIPIPGDPGGRTYAPNFRAPEGLP